MSKTIKVACRAAGEMRLEEMTIIQGDLKELTEENYFRLRAQILDRGFSSPIFLWPFEGKHNVLDGTQRHRTLCKMRDEEGYEIPPLPYAIIEAETEAEARRKLLAFASQFGTVTRQGLYEYLHDSAISFDEMQQGASLPGIDVQSFHDEYFGDYVAPGGEPPHSADQAPGADGALPQSAGGLGATVAEQQINGEGRKLADQFLVPPFSVLDARQGYWKVRKEQWLRMGIKSEIGRGENLLKMSDTILQPDPEKRTIMASSGSGNKGALRIAPLSKAAVAAAAEGTPAGAGTSIFDPVLTELAYRWFSPKDGHVLDPFAGGSVRGIVASKLGRQYVGIDLRQEQVSANKEQANALCEDPHPIWICGDSRNAKELVGNHPGFDLVFSCPPYADLEVYSDDPQDLSTLSYPLFREAYRAIIRGAVAMLKPDRFAAFVVGEVREKDRGGFYRCFVPDTIAAFQDAGAMFYNEAILVTSVGTLALRAGRVFTAGRKLGKTHQQLLVFCKGDPKKATEACGTVEITIPEGMEQGELEVAAAAAELPLAGAKEQIGGEL